MKAMVQEPQKWMLTNLQTKERLPPQDTLLARGDGTGLMNVCNSMWIDTGNAADIGYLVDLRSRSL